MISIALTGGIGAGKTTVAGYFEDMGATCLYADKIVHQFLTRGTAIYYKTISLFGTSILFPETGEIDKPKLAQIIFKDHVVLKNFLDVFYPYIKKELMSRMVVESEKGTKLFLFDASQIIEAGWESIFDIIILVVSKFDIRVKRVSGAGKMDIEQICLRNNSQWPDSIKIRYADYIIDNNGSIMETKKAVRGVYREIMAFYAEHI